MKASRFTSLHTRLEREIQGFDGTVESRVPKILETVPGYGGWSHFLFFYAVLKLYRPQKILILGVYKGRDTSFILEAARLLNHEIELVCVDKFEDTFCDDWDEDARELSWEEAGFGVAPSIEVARQNIEAGNYSGYTLHKTRDEDYLKSSSEMFDFVYIDTAHDYHTVFRQICQVYPHLKPDAILAGDDYLALPNWGVIEAVRDNTTAHSFFRSSIWFTSQDQVRPSLKKSYWNNPFTLQLKDKEKYFDIARLISEITTSSCTQSVCISSAVQAYNKTWITTLEEEQKTQCLLFQAGTACKEMLQKIIAGLQSQDVPISIILTERDFSKIAPAIALLRKNAHLPLRLYILQFGYRFYEALPTEQQQLLSEQLHRIPKPLPIQRFCAKFHFSYSKADNIDRLIEITKTPHTTLSVVECDLQNPLLSFFS